MHESAKAIGEKHGQVGGAQRAYTKPTLTAEAGWQATTGFDTVSGMT